MVFAYLWIFLLVATSLASVKCSPFATKIEIAIESVKKILNRLLYSTTSYGN